MLAKLHGNTNRDTLEIETRRTMLEVRSDDLSEKIDKLTQRRTLKILADRRKNKPTAHAVKLCTEYSRDICEMMPRYKNITRLSNSTKTRSFFFKNYCGLLYGNHDLCKFGYKQSKECENCECKDQTIQHILVLCPKTRELRERLYTEMHMNPGRFEERYGTGEPAIDYILLQLNRYVYQCKWLESTPTIHGFKALLKSEYAAEKSMAEKTKGEKQKKRSGNIYDQRFYWIR